MPANLKLLFASLAVSMSVSSHADASELPTLPTASRICGAYGCERVPVPDIPKPRPAKKIDLSIGVKGFKLGMQEAQALALFEAMTKEAGGLYAPACGPRDNGRDCIAIAHKITYGMSEVAVIRLNFTNAGMDQLHFTLSMAGCSNVSKTERHPRKQFDSLASLLTEQFGSPVAASERRKVWLDESALLLLDLGPPEEGVNVYPGCDSTKIIYMDRRKAEARLRTKQAKDRDL